MQSALGNMPRISPWRLVRLLSFLLLVFMVIVIRQFYTNKHNKYTGRQYMSVEQKLVNYIAQNLQVKYNVINNLDSKNSFTAKITFTNTGSKPIVAGPWQLYFTHLRDIEAAGKNRTPAELANRMLVISHVNGGVYQLKPTLLFAPINPGNSLEIPFRARAWVAAKTDVYPNWYVSVRGAKSVIVNSTRESLAFVGDFDQGQLWKRTPHDLHNPFTPKEQFIRNDITNLGKAGGYIIPTPLKVKVSNGESITVTADTWVIIGRSDDLKNEVDYLVEKTGMKEVQKKPENKFIELRKGKVDLPGADVNADEAYSLNVNKHEMSIRITGQHPAGVFYGVQSLLSLLADDGQTVPVIRIFDAPRYKYRGFMLDVVRNFRPKKQVMELIDVMASYKLNKFHFHLTDDEGWRIEIPKLPELTTVGSKRCDDKSEMECLLPFNGAGVDGTHDGYYTVNDYKEILQFAKQRHVEVIPEVDVPSHAHAAIKAMKARYKRLLLIGKKPEAEKYLLHDIEDASVYLSVQAFNDNVINVCMESSYHFMELVITSIMNYHNKIAPMKTFHIGGDEVPKTSLKRSPKCKSFMKMHGFTSQGNITRYFSQRLISIGTKYNIAIQGWEDAFYGGTLIHKFNGAMPKFANSWLNPWRDGHVYRAHDLANHDHKVILSSATHLYFDHPHEPHPDERGMYWATRFIDLYKVFGFMPDNFYGNIDIDRFGKRLSKSDVCGKKNVKCPELLKPQNIIGMGAHLWSETVRTEEHLHMMTFPRLIAMAERAWYRANWELEPNMLMRKRRKNEDWVNFTNTLGYHELPRLEKQGIKYHLPAPGAYIDNGVLKINSGIPGLPFVASRDRGRTWIKLKNNYRIAGKMLLATSSLDGKRRSRSIEMRAD